MSGLENDVLVAKNVNFDYTSNPPHSGIVIADGQLLIGSTANPNISMVANTLTAGTGMTITNGPGTITIATTASLTDLHTARYIVSSSGTNGTGANYTTIAAAIAGAVSSGVNSTIFIQPGTYTENFTLPANINLAAYTCDALTPNVTIVGTITCTDAGSRSISGIRLQTNSAALLTVSGTLATVVNLDDCYLNCTNNTGITFSSSSASSAINITNCKGNLGTTGIGLFAASGSGSLTFSKSRFSNSGSSTTASTISSGILNAESSSFGSPITTSSTAILILTLCFLNTIATNTTSLTHNGSGQSSAHSCIFSSGSASSISIGGSATLALADCNVSSTNANAITGAGTLNYGQIVFTGTSSTINTSTTNLLPVGKIYAINGITFDNSSTLSIFSQGTFTPTIRGSATAGTIAYTTQSGRYQKVGRVVTVSMVVLWTTIGAATGAVQCNNLPFTVINDASACTVPSLVVAGGGGVIPTAASGVPFLQGNANTTTANINYYLGAAGTNNASTITASNGFSVQYTYETT